MCSHDRLGRGRLALEYEGWRDVYVADVLVLYGPRLRLVRALLGFLAAFPAGGVRFLDWD